MVDPLDEDPHDSQHDGRHESQRAIAAGEHSWDVALARLEDYLLGYPFDRVLPDLADLVHFAAVPVEFLVEDERAVKVIHEAIQARPLSSAGAIAALRSEVEMLTLEAVVLAQRLRDPGTTVVAARDATHRLALLQRRLDEVRRLL